MAYAGRDEETAKYVDRIIEAGAIHEEFEFFSCACVGGDGGYYVSGKEKSVFGYQVKNESMGRLCSPADKSSYWTKVAKGERAALKKRYQGKCMAELQQRYTPEFLRGMKAFVDVPQSNAALPLLESWEESIQYDPDEDSLLLFRETVRFAALRKTLDRFESARLQGWADRSIDLMRELSYPDGEAHAFAGFAVFEGSGAVQRRFTRYVDAWNAQRKSLQEGRRTSPLFVRDQYYFATDFRVISAQKERFKSDMERVMDDAYLELVGSLYSLDTPVPEESWNAFARSVHESGTEHEKRLVEAYATLMGLHR